MPDTTLHITDTLHHALTDSVLAAAQNPDSATLADTLLVPAVLPPPSGMEGWAHPSLPATENWVFALLAVLFLLLTSGIIRSVSAFIGRLKSFLSHREPVNLLEIPTANVFQFQLFITIFSICVFALTAGELLFEAPEKFRITTFVFLCGCFLAYYILKYLLFEIMGNTFFDAKTTRSYRTMYFSMMSAAAILVFPVLILYTYQPPAWHQPLTVALIATAAVFYIVLIIKLLQIFYVKPLALFYIFLYLCTLEILPIFVLFRVGSEFLKSY